MHFLPDSAKRKLLENPNVDEVTEKHIHYSANFKILAVERFQKGDSPGDIFRDAGFDLSLFEENYCLFTLKRWKKKYEEDGKNSFLKSNTGAHATGRPKSENLNQLTYEELQTIVEIQREIIADLELKKKLALAKKK